MVVFVFFGAFGLSVHKHRNHAGLAAVMPLCALPVNISPVNVILDVAVSLIVKQAIAPW